MKGKAQVDMVRPLARQTSVVAMIAAIILTMGAPLALYRSFRRGLDADAASYARRMAELVQDVVVTQPELWYYDTPKLAKHLRLLVEGPEVQQVVVIDSLGRRIAIPRELERGAFGAIWWTDAPVYRGHQEVARVWVAIDAGMGLMQVVVSLIFSFVLGATLSTLLYALPVAVVGRAERRIIDLLAKLESARSDLASLNTDLEGRVEERSRQYAETAEALIKSEAQLREVAGRAVEATEQERQRVGRELHDGVGQMLTAIRLSLQVLWATLKRDGSLKPDEPLHQRLREAEKLVDETIDELRRIAMNLHPAALSRLGLVEALTELCSSVAARAELEVSFQCDDLPDGGQLPAALESSCYRLVQEALTNVVRYAAARHIDVSVGLGEGCLIVRVTDDGAGFDPLKAELGEGMGLRGMRDRAALLGGTLSITTGEGEGTSIEVTLPAGKIE